MKVMLNLLDMIRYKFGQFKKSIRSRIENFINYRKIIQKVKKLPNMEMNKVKINGLFRTVDMRIRINNG